MKTWQHSCHFGKFDCLSEKVWKSDLEMILPIHMKTGELLRVLSCGI